MPGKFYLAVAGYIINKNGKVLVLKRSSERDHEGGFWETVSGRLEQHVREVKDELLREVREELGDGFKCEVIAPFGTYNFYRGGDRTQELVGIDYICRYISGRIKLSKEHTEYRWIDPKEFENYHASESLKSKVKLLVKVRDWYLDNALFFKGYK